ncbi:MAG: CoA transferase [Dehalococcoidia bacterium]|nr:CoA transferase [Dehalococcoidia bacterium]
MGPLEGIKVVELGTFFAAPRCGRHLADMGADLIKVEPLRGDPLRGIEAVLGVPILEYNWTFELTNRNKRSLTLDLSTQQGKDIIYELVKKADIFLTSCLPYVQKKLEVDYETMRKVNPKIIFAEVTAWGLSGPDKDRDGYDAACPCQDRNNRRVG